MIEDQFIEIRQDEDDGGNFSHPVQGFDLKISRKGEGQNDTEYKVTASGTRPSPLSADADQMEDWISNQPDLSRFLRVLSDEAIERKLNGEEGGRDSDDETPRSRRDNAVDASGAKTGRSSAKAKPSRTVDTEIEDADIVIED
jgi:hypothetical protein